MGFAAVGQVLFPAVVAVEGFFEAIFLEEFLVATEKDRIFGVEEDRGDVGRVAIGVKDEAGGFFHVTSPFGGVRASWVVCVEAVVGETTGFEFLLVLRATGEVPRDGVQVLDK